MTELQIREATPDDAPMCGRIMFDAFEALATRHHFPIEAGTPQLADFQIKAMLDTDGIYGLVAERDGHIVGSAYRTSAERSSASDPSLSTRRHRMRGRAVR